jgi:hypothetical protein
MDRQHGRGVDEYSGAVCAWLVDSLAAKKATLLQPAGLQFLPHEYIWKKGYWTSTRSAAKAVV